MKTNISRDALHKIIVDNSEITSSLGEIIIISTEDKIKLCLINHIKNLEQKKGWTTPLGLVFTISLTLITTDFKDFLLTKETWQAIFIIMGSLGFIWLVIAIFNSFRSKTVEDLVEEIKKGSIKKDGPDARPENKLSIIKARYGTEERNIDVTQSLNNLISDNKLSVLALNSIHGDPAPGQKKKLTVRYRHGDTVRTKEFKEPSSCHIP